MDQYMKHTYQVFGLISELELLVVPNFTLDVRSRSIVVVVLIDPIFHFDWEWLLVPNFTSIWVFCCCCCLCLVSHFDVGCVYCVFWLALILFGSMYWCYVPFLFLYVWFLRFLGFAIDVVGFLPLWRVYMGWFCTLCSSYT
jgi:hypothetical protein